VALNEGASLSDLAKKIDAKNSTISRHLLDLGERNRKMEPGLKLVEYRQSPLELRRHEYALTSKGGSVIRSILSAFRR
jgi:DNA-binding MarR family transcriptional regulator